MEVLYFTPPQPEGVGLKCEMPLKRHKKSGMRHPDGMN
jgi:hypothetical protein